ncbi:sporulation integral membrane protein YlbJ [Anaerovirgula multivorans]|uniref:Sporulation integral membrane protein YlbJ n=1 Tax=Anaerovirgula multivorans TaxID=312168 RepID=A0A239A5G3_9FIRM|nr:sporulation integral membrane protein YlbJ [Anaerovirgula multivorans]SNR90541.1 sporulation integral membrane protein YlbJ [Anaerovirgula multivorans]
MSIIITLLLLVIIGAAFVYFLKGSFTRFQNFFGDYVIVAIVVMLVFCIIIFPNESVKAAYNGLNIWVTVVLPALLPFFIGSELLVGLGVVKFVGTLLEPIMRPLFNVPGEGSFAFAMSVTSGYPVGVKIATKLRNDHIVSKVEAQRLVSFCSTSGPLFLVGAVSIGMFKSSEIGILLATAHYLAAIIVGLFFSFYKRGKVNTRLQSYSYKNQSIIKRAILNLASTRSKAPSFGILLGNAVKESINTMLMVGGFIILFSVIINILELIGFVSFISKVLFFFLKPLHIELPIIKALITGLFEITMGCKIAAGTLSASLINRIAAAAFIIGWSGFSIHAQSISIISITDINSYLYIFSKFFHGVLSYALIYLLYPIFTLFFTFSVPASNHYQQLSIYHNLFNNFKLSVEFFLVILITLLLFSLIVGFFTYMTSCLNKKR